MARGHFVQPASGVELVSDLAELSSPISSFIKERCTLDPASEISRADLYFHFQSWCDLRGQPHTGGDAAFGRDLRAAVPTLRYLNHRVDGRLTRFYGGIAIRSDAGNTTSDAGGVIDATDCF